MTDRRRLLSPRDVEAEFGLSTGLQARWRMYGLFAPYLRVGKGVFYERSDVERWIQANKRLSSRERPPATKATAVA